MKGGRSYGTRVMAAAQIRGLRDAQARVQASKGEMGRTAATLERTRNLQESIGKELADARRAATNALKSLYQARALKLWGEYRRLTENKDFNRYDGVESARRQGDIDTQMLKELDRLKELEKLDREARDVNAREEARAKEEAQAKERVRRRGEEKCSARIQLTFSRWN